MPSEKPALVWGFQSPEVAEIHRHLSDAEKAALRRILLRHSIVLGISVTALSLLLRYGFHFEHKAFWADMAWSSLLSFVVGLLWLPWTNAAMKAFFASTAYAKNRGWANLRLYAFTRKARLRDTAPAAQD